ncbi:putative heme d1 biosynthesis radical SAM protein NirJ1 [Clostridium sp. LBM24168]
MIGISKLLCKTENFGDKLRYIEGASKQKNGVSTGRGPVVVWNCTRTCNLKCRHCYENSDCRVYKNELNTCEAKKFILDLKEFKVPVLIFSGGEPLLRGDLFELLQYSSRCGIRSTISTNGTLIDRETANKFKQYGVGYVGISLDGIGKKHDEFRGVEGSFHRALSGIRNCREAGQKVGLRFTISKNNYDQLEDIFYLIEHEKIDRVCFYHLVYSGRGSSMIDDDISHDQAREAMKLIMDKAIELKDSVEILTVDNHADSVYLYLRIRDMYPELANSILQMIKFNGGNRSGIAIANVDYRGNVHPDQFTQQYIFGNVRNRKFGDIWTDTSNPIMKGLKERKSLLKGRCGSCRWIDMCNGNFRARAEAVTGDFWESDPACYLTDDEIV